MSSNKSRHLVKALALVLVVLVGVLSFTACDLFLTQEEIDAKNQAEISVYNIGSVPQRFTAIYGQRLDLGVLVKSGYMIDNVTDADGNIYFDYTGQSLSNWQKSFPTEFYANFILVGNLSYTYDTKWTSTETVSGVGWDHLDFGFKGDVRKQFQSALRGNPSRKVKLTVTYRERGEGSSGNLYFKVRVNSDEVVYSTSTRYIGETYITTTQEVELNASLWINGFRLSWAGDAWYFFHYVKDVNVTIAFV